MKKEKINEKYSLFCVMQGLFCSKFTPKSTSALHP